MTPAEHDKLNRRRTRLLRELHRLPNLMRGTVYERRRKCGRPSCPCASGGPRHPALQLNVNVRGRTRTRYVPVEGRAAVQAMVESYRRLWRIVEELTEVNLALFSAAGRRVEKEGGGKK